jgi:hypothetical protein
MRGVSWHHLGVKMKIIKVILIVAIAITTTAYLSYSQNRKQRVKIARGQINAIFANTNNNHFRAGEVVDIDSSIGKDGISDGNICDPYGTLKRCYIFTAVSHEDGSDDVKYAIGVFKDSQIVWMSDMLPGSEYYGYVIQDEGFLATKDLNRMGKVDIAAFFSDGTNPPSGYYLWIFSWDGKKGKYINQQESDGSTSIAADVPFDIADVDGDGIYEVRAISCADTLNDSSFYDLKIKAIYKWNGSVYALQK